MRFSRLLTIGLISVVILVAFIAIFVTAQRQGQAQYAGIRKPAATTIAGTPAQHPTSQPTGSTTKPVKLPGGPLSPSQIQTAVAQHPQQDQGSPAIKPSRSTGSPHVTRADVQAYLSNHPFQGGPTTSGKPAKLLTVDLITSKAASTRLYGEWIGLPDTALVYYVRYQGPFKRPMGPPVIGATPAPPPPPIATATEIFDAQTGNLLLWNI